MTAVHGSDYAAERHVTSLLPIVAKARKAGGDAHRTALAKKGDRGSAGWAWACIAISSENRPLIRTLDEANMGEFNAWHCDYRVQIGDLIEPSETKVQSIEVQRDGLETFASAIRSAGFAVTLEDLVD